MNCPKCGSRIHLDAQSVEINNTFNITKWGEIPEGFYRCWGCGFIRPFLWWATIELDINTEIILPKEEKKIVPLEEIPEELNGPQEAGWNG